MRVRRTLPYTFLRQNPPQQKPQQKRTRKHADMFSVEIAGIPLAIDNRYTYVKQLCANYCTDTPPESCAFTVSASPEEIAAENDGSNSFSPAYCESLAIYRKISLKMLDYQAFLFHAVVIAHKGRGYAFTAKSGAGKSTHVMQWLNALGSEVSVVNGDKPLLRWHEDPRGAMGSMGGAHAAAANTPVAPAASASAARAAHTPAAPVASASAALANHAVPAAPATSTGEFVAYGTPYNGKEGWGHNISAPLHAVCFIERCQPGEPDKLTRLSNDAEIISRLMTQILLPHDPLLATQQLSLLDKLVTSTPFYLLRCTPTKAAFDAAFQMTLCDNEQNPI